MAWSARRTASRPWPRPALGFDLILMDVNLPLMDGLEATRRIRAEATGARTPIIALSAHALTSDEDKAINAGADAYHTKPVELPLLLEQIERLLKPPPAS